MSKELRCKDCGRWYGGEDEGFGPCSVKRNRGDPKYITFGAHLCDEPSVVGDTDKDQSNGAK